MFTKILYHRGSMTAPENTIPAFKGARDSGADGVELDVQLTSDQIPVVIHDWRVDRTTDGTGEVSDFSLAELQKLEIPAKKLPPQRVPTLRSVLEVISDMEIINLELKLFSDNGYKNNSALPGIIELVFEMGLKDNILISSYNHYTIKEIAGRWPQINTGILFHAALYRPWEYANRLGVKGLHCFHKNINSTLIEKSHSQGLKVVAYGTDNGEKIRSLIAAGVDLIITEAVETAVRERKKIERFREEDF